MICASCGTTNTDDASFCNNCGQSLASGCPQCGTENPPQANFCNNCGSSLREVGAPDAHTDPSERRLVSALFADLVGFTPLSESRDAEEVRSMLLRYFEDAQRVVERFGGQIDKYTGDAVTAFWGARQTREDDAERAVRAALELVESVAGLGEELDIPDLRLRAGVLSGEASVGAGGNETGLVVGDIVNTAARLQAAAEPGTVLVGDKTRLLAGTGLSFEPVGMVELKGKSAPVAAYRAIGTLVDRTSGTGLEPAFVGRDPELRMLEDQVQVAAREQRARLLSIVGDGGIGKSRLVSEFHARSPIETSSRLVHWGRSPSYGDGVTFWALGEMVRERAGIAETDDAQASSAKLRSALSSYCPDPEERKWILPRLAGLLGLDPMPEGGRDELFGALRTFFQLLAEQATTVLVFEDLQWADEGLLDFIVDLVERSRSHPILVVTLARPELLERYPGWGASRRGFTSVHLGPLSDIDIATLVEQTVPGIEPETVDLVVGAAAGVPLYAVEYIRMLLDSGDLVPEGDRFRQVGDVERLDLPDSLHAMVGARLDRLGPEERATIQDAAVLGQSFQIDRLAMATSRGTAEIQTVVDRLVRADIFRLEEDLTSPERGQYAFVQSTIREVAYGRLSRAERKQRHLAIVERFEGAGPEFAAIVAGHYLSALEAGPDPELAMEARTALAEAARRATELHANRQAIGLVEQALAIPGDDAARADLLDLGAAAASAAQEHGRAAEMAHQALEWWEHHGDSTGIVAATARYAEVSIGAEHPRQAIEAIERRFDVQRLGDPGMARLGYYLALARDLLGEHEQSAEIAADLLEAADLHGDPELITKLLQIRGSALLSVGRSYESHALLMEGARLAREIGSPALESQAISRLTFGDGRNGRLRDLEMPLRLKELAQKASSPAVERRAFTWMGRILTAAGRFEEAREGYLSLDLSGDSPIDRYDRSRLGFLDWVIEGDFARLDESDAEVRGGEGGSEIASFNTFINSVLAQNAFARGDAESAYRHAMSADHTEAVPHSFLFDTPIFAALRLRDPDRIRTAKAILPMGTGPRFDSLAAVAEASLDVLERGSEEAIEEFISTAEQHGTVDGGVEAAKLKAILAELHPDSPVAREAGQDALEWFTDHGAKGYVALFAPVWDAIGAEEART